VGYPYFDEVNRAHADLVNEGKIKRRATQEEVEQDKGLLTARAGYYVNSERDPSIGLLSKPSGNNFPANSEGEKYSVDWHVRNSDGEGWDVATDNDMMAVPSDGGPYGADPARIPDWRMPTAELAQIEEDTDTDTDTDEDVEIDEKLDYIIDLLSTVEVNIIENSNENTQKIIDKLDHIVNQAEETLKKIGVGLLIIKRNNDEQEDAAELIIKILKAITSDQPSVTKAKK
jgi:hypothetical protein